MNQTHYIVSVPSMEYFIESLKNLTSEVEYYQRIIIRLWDNDSKELGDTIEGIKKDGTFINMKRPSNWDDDNCRFEFIDKIMRVKTGFEHQGIVLEQLDSQGK